MVKHFDENAWIQAIQNKDWYLRLYGDLTRLLEKAEHEADQRKEIKEEVYGFFDKHLEIGDIKLGENGPNWDKERKPIDTIVIHHTKGEPGITWQRLSSVQLIRLYAKSYNDKGRDGAVYSSHFRDGHQVFYAYHWLIRADGRVERLLSDDEIGWHAGNWDVNTRSIAICLDGNFEYSSPSDSAISSMREIIRSNYSHITGDHIVGHCEINPKTTCPGDEFMNGWKKKIIKNLK